MPKKKTPKKAKAAPQKNDGLFWHVHHETLYEYCWDADERRRYIRCKPTDEVKTRLRLMKAIKGDIGSRKAREAVEKAQAELNEVIQVKEALENACNRINESFHKALKYRNLAITNLERSISTAKAEALHKKECKGCPWNGRTIFPNKPNAG